MASTDSKAIPIKNAALRITAPIFNASGDLVTGAAGLTPMVSKDGGTFVNCTNAATEIATASGMYYLDLTATEMNADTVAVIIKTSTSGAKTTPIVLYTAARSINDLAFPTVSGRNMDVDASAGVTVGTVSATALASIADNVLSRAVSNVEASANFRSLAGAIAKLVNKVAIAGATLTVYKTDDTTAMATQAVVVDATASPIVSVDTV